MTYFVVLPDGQKFGPADTQLLNQWVAEGRVLANTMLEDSITGQRIPASHIPGLQLAPAQPPGPYAPPGAGPGPQQPYAGYYRGGPAGGAVMDTGQNDLTLAYVFGALGLLMCFGGGLCGPCALVGLVFPILGVVFANKAQQKGNPGAQGAKILAWVGIGLQIAALLLYVVILSFGMMS